MIFYLFIGALKTWGLDMNKCVGFGSDGASTMVLKNTCVATLLKNVNPFLISTHCVVQKYHKICWLSRFQVVTTLCDSLEFVLVHLRDSYSSPGVDGTHVLYDKLREFKFIYVLYFLAYILQMFGKLSKIFQCKLVDISCLVSIVKNKIAFIKMYFLVDVCDLNQETFIFL